MLKRMIFVTALLFGLLSVSFAQENNAKKFAGVWIGTLDMGGQTMTVIFKLQEKDGKLSGTGESPEQGGGAIALENFVVNGNKLQFEIPAVQAGFDGVYKEDKKNIDGTLVINQQGMPLLLTKENDAKKFAGVWIGSIDAGGQAMTVIFKLQEKEGKLSGTGESPEQGGGAITLENFVINGNKIQFEIPAVQAGFDGVYKEDKKNIDGTLVINQQGMPLLLTKDEKAVIEPEKKFDSFWEGTLNVQGTNLRLVIKTFKKADGTLGAFLDSPDQKVANLPVTSFTVTADELKFEVNPPGILYTGKIDKATMTAKGTFSQGGQEFPLDMKKVEKPTE